MGGSMRNIKKIFSYLGITTLALMSFIATEKTITVITNIYIAHIRAEPSCSKCFISGFSTDSQSAF